jgi:hypothetical protein
MIAPPVSLVPVGGSSRAIRTAGGVLGSNYTTSCGSIAPPAASRETLTCARSTDTGTPRGHQPDPLVVVPLAPAACAVRHACAPVRNQHHPRNADRAHAARSWRIGVGPEINWLAVGDAGGHKIHTARPRPFRSRVTVLRARSAPAGSIGGVAGAGDVGACTRNRWWASAEPRRGKNSASTRGGTCGYRAADFPSA